MEDTRIKWVSYEGVTYIGTQEFLTTIIGKALSSGGKALVNIDDEILEVKDGKLSRI